MKNFVFSLLSIAICLVLLEGLGRLATRFLLKQSSSNILEVYKGSAVFNEYTWYRDFEPHPFFGYLHPWQHKILENFDDYDKPNDFVILILGGSVAESFGRYVQNDLHFDTAIRKILPSIGARPIRILNFAIGGGHQPQQFFMASYLYEHADLILNLEGYNEMRPSFADHFMPYEYSPLTLWFFRAPNVAYVQRALMSGLVGLYLWFTELPQRNVILGSSHFYFVLWLSFTRVAGSVAHYLTDSMVAETLRRVPAHPLPGEDELNRVKLSIWKKYVTLESRLAGSEENKTIFLLQPNQYLKDSKPMSDDERARAIDEKVESAWNRRMLALREAVRDLRSHGIRVFDLTDIFKNVPAPVYTDRCCHLNRLGNELLSEAVLRTVAEELRAGGK